MFGGQELGEARVVGEMPGDEGDVDVAGFRGSVCRCRVSRVARKAGVLLGEGAKGVSTRRAWASWLGLRAAGGGDGFRNVGLGALGDFGKGFAGGGVGGREGLARRGGCRR